MPLPRIVTPGARPARRPRLSSPPAYPRVLALAAAALLAPLLSSFVAAQANPARVIESPPIATSEPTRESEVPDVPGLSSLLHGVNAGITFSGIHDSITGWSTLVTPAVGYSFNSTFTADVSVPIYFFRLSPTTAARPRPQALLITERGQIGDVVLAGHAQFYPRLFQYQTTFALAIPVGEAKNGLTSGKVSFDFTNHLEHTFHRLTPNLELGFGNSTSLVNRITTKNYASLGPLSHYQVGIGVPLPRGISFDAAAYEQLPIGDQKTYGLNRRGTALIITGRNIYEDNGFIDSLDVPVSPHITFSGYYNRSLRFHADTTAIGLTYVLRGAPPAEEDLPLDDLFR